MAKKTVFTTFCMLFAIGCTGVQTNNKSNTSNDEAANSLNNGDNDHHNKSRHDKTSHLKRGKSEVMEIDLGESSNRRIEDINNVRREVEEDIANERVMDISRLVDKTMPNSDLVIKKLSEIKNEQEMILSRGNSSQKKQVAIQNRLIKSYRHWKGTKYAFGGDSADGIDCSAFTRRVYREAFDYELPRNTVSQIKVGTQVSRQNLKPGDIVYFKPDGGGNHTAVYLGNSLFLNASTSKGVVISTLENVYWSKNFRYGVRVNRAQEAIS